ncbi:MAG: secondary thiamine-phosphate synthase enzyme YjbQ [Candidatus Bathyarchaeota archaeon]
MKIFLEKINIPSTKRIDLIDITRHVENFVRRCGVTDGLCLVYALHTTAAIIVNEHEGGLIQDIISKVEQTFPRGAGYLHDRIDDNADAHLASTFIGPSKTFPIKDNKIIRGTWQNIFFLETDGPRSQREVIMEILGEEMNKNH